MLAGGSGLNTVVIVNQHSSESCKLGSQFCELRALPPENVIRISWSGSAVSWSSVDFSNQLLMPLTVALTERGIASQIDNVVLSMGIPFQTIFNGTNVNSTTSALFYGLKMDSVADIGVTNSFAASESVFRDAKPASALGMSFLATMITADTLDSAKQIVNRGVASDGTTPIQPVILAKTSDPDRNVRHLMFDNTVFNARVLGRASITRTNSNNPSDQSGLFGYQTGLMRYQVSPDTFIPGAIADSMTSFGGVIFGLNDQTNLLGFIEAGATGSYGTVAEPLSDTEKFPNPQVYFYQARGFSLVESYYLSVVRPYLGLTVAEPLSSPFALRGSGAWAVGVSNSVLTGNSPLTVAFSAHDASRPLAQVDLFVDGKFHATVTNLLPRANNILSVALNGYPINFTVPTNATIGSIATNLTALINDPVVTNATKIKALQWGDRIELQSISTNHSSFPFHTPDSVSLVQSGAVYRVKYLPDSFPPRILPASPDNSGIYRMQVEIPTALNYVIQATTNLVEWSPIFTNTQPGLFDFRDWDSTNYSRRFYRVVGPVPDLPPKLSAPSLTNGGAFRLRMESQIGQPATILVSSNQLDWIPAETNTAGGMIDWVDNSAASVSHRFYRAWIPPISLPTLTATNLNTQSALVRIDNPIQPYVVEVCTNAGNWVGLVTNFVFQGIQATATSEIGNADLRSTFLNLSRPAFTMSEAHGVQEYKITSNIISNGAWMRLVITKTNGQVVIVGLTNQIAGINATNLAAQLVAMVNTNAALQGSDGLTADDFSFNPTFSTFYLRARSPGYQAARIQVYAHRSSSSLKLIFSFGGGYNYLTQNISDLQPRNHLYVTAGLHNIASTFSLDTTTLPDGHHELTAVAYEGSSVRTQTRATVPVCISNTSLTATMTLIGLTNNASAQGSYQIQVAANTNNISSITLFTTGGAMATATNVSDVIFPVHGTNLWDGLHPFYALVEAATGEKYRTRTEWIRLAP